MDSGVPVSYTHLDVYKRQTQIIVKDLNQLIFIKCNLLILLNCLLILLISFGAFL